MASRSEAISFEDAALVQQARDGDSRAFESLVIKYQDRVYHICYRLVGHRESAQDLAQEAFCKAFEGLRSFEQKSSFYTWLFRIAVNLSISLRRKGTNHKMHSLSLVGQEMESHSESEGLQAAQLRRMGREANVGGPAEELQRRETQQLVLRALEQLDPEQRTILVLRDMESLDYETIAKVLDIPVGTVRSRLHRSRMALRERLKPAMEKAG